MKWVGTDEKADTKTDIVNHSKNKTFKAYFYD